MKAVDKNSPFTVGQEVRIREIFAEMNLELNRVDPKRFLVGLNQPEVGQLSSEQPQ